MQTTKKNLWFHFLDVVFNIIVIIAIVAGVRTFLVSPFQVEGNSMASTLENSEYIIINKLAYRIDSPDRGDIAVFHPPSKDSSKYYVKRVIGLPGDIVTIREGNVYLQPEGSEEEIELDEPYLNEDNIGQTFRHPPGSGNTREISYEVPEGSYFLLGDNRKGSLDSRSFIDTNGEPHPFVAEEDIAGKVWFIALPINKIHAFEAPDYLL